MKPEEFKAWFEGYVENIDGTPSGAQWARIMAKVKELAPAVVVPDTKLQPGIYSPNILVGQA